MKRPPVFATALVALAILAMIGLGIWQLGRAREKDRMIAEYSVARRLPAVDLDPLVAAGSRRPDVGPPPLSFRRVRVTCYPSREVPPRVRAGRDRGTQMPGSSYFIPCFWDEAYSWAEGLEINGGWANRPDLQPVLPPNAEWAVEGMIGEVRRGRRIVITADRPLPPLRPSAAPRIEDIANNHLLYAFQWFFFALAAAIIYVLALRRRLSAAAGPTKGAAP